MSPRSSSFLSSWGGPKRVAVNRSQRILIDVFLSVCYSLDCIVPQGSCLGPLLFVIYATKWLRISFYALTWTTDRFLWVLNLTATHIPGGCKWSDGMLRREDQALASGAMMVAWHWLIRGRFLVNDDKTKFMVIGTQQQLWKLQAMIIKLSSSEITPNLHVRNLGCYLGSNLCMCDHITNVCKEAFF